MNGVFRMQIEINELVKEIHQNNLKSGWWHLGDINLVDVIHNPEGEIMNRLGTALVAEKLS